MTDAEFRQAVARMRQLQRHRASAPTRSVKQQTSLAESAIDAELEPKPAGPMHPELFGGLK